MPSHHFQGAAVLRQPGQDERPESQKKTSDVGLQENVHASETAYSKTEDQRPESSEAPMQQSPTGAWAFQEQEEENEKKINLEHCARLEERVHSILQVSHLTLDTEKRSIPSY